MLGVGANPLYYPSCASTSSIRVCPDDSLGLFTFLESTTLINTENIGIPTTPTRIYTKSVHKSGEIRYATSLSCTESINNVIDVSLDCQWVCYCLLLLLLLFIILSYQDHILNTNSWSRQPTTESNTRHKFIIYQHQLRHLVS